MGEYVRTPARIAAFEAARLRGGWTDERVQELRDLNNQGVMTREIGRRLGVSKNAVIGKLGRLGEPIRSWANGGEKSRQILAIKRSPIEASSAPGNCTWTPERDARLRDMAIKGLTTTEIARAFGDVSRTAVHNRLVKFGMWKPAPPMAISSLAAASEKAPSGEGDNKPWISTERLDQRMRQAEGSASNPLPLHELDRRQCRWPLGGMFDPPDLFCAEATSAEGPYCAAHAAISRVPSSRGGASAAKDLIRSVRRYL